MTKKIEEEAQDFIKDKVSNLDKTLLRFYAGAALTGLIPINGGHSQYRQDIINEAFAWAKDMVEKEKELGLT